MTTTRAIANDIGAAPISDNSCATPSNHSGMVVFPQSDRIRRYLRPESYFSTQPLTGNWPCVWKMILLHGEPNSAFDAR
jgi:hypothetical protein